MENVKPEPANIEDKDYAAEEEKIVRDYISKKLDKIFAEIDKRNLQADCELYNMPGFR